MKDGTVYRNLYYPTSWEDVSHLLDLNIKSIFFLYKNKDNTFKRFELQCSDIDVIDIGEGTSNSFFCYYDDDYNCYTINYDNMGDEANHNHTDNYVPILKEIHELVDKFFEDRIEKLEIDESYKDTIHSNVVAMVMGYLETFYEEIDIDENIKDEALYTEFFIVTVIMADYMTEKIEQDPNLMMRDILGIIPEFSDYLCANRNKVIIEAEEEADKPKEPDV